MLALTATPTLAIAIGANTASFRIVDSILIRPLPYPDADRLYWITEYTERWPTGRGFGVEL